MAGRRPTQAELEQAQGVPPGSLDGVFGEEHALKNAITQFLLVDREIRPNKAFPLIHAETKPLHLGTEK